MAMRNEVTRLLEVIERVEGGSEAFIRSVQNYSPLVANYPEAYNAAKQALFHALWDWASRDLDAFIEFFGQRWAPLGAINDPNNLNADWAKNVTRIYREGC